MVNVLEKYEFEFEYRNVSKDRSQFEEMVQKSGQYSSPCVEIDGHMLADVGGDEVLSYMRQKNLVS